MPPSQRPPTISGCSRSTIRRDPENVPAVTHKHRSSTCRFAVVPATFRSCQENLFGETIAAGKTAKSQRERGHHPGRTVAPHRKDREDPERCWGTVGDIPSSGTLPHVPDTVPYPELGPSPSGISWDFSNEFWTARVRRRHEKQRRRGDAAEKPPDLQGNPFPRSEVGQPRRTILVHACQPQERPPVGGFAIAALRSGRWWRKHGSPPKIAAYRGFSDLATAPKILIAMSIPNAILLGDHPSAHC